MTATTTTIDHWARDLLLQAWARELPDRPQTLAALQALQAVCRLESDYGRGWTGAMVGSRNWGAVQCRARQDAQGHCPPGCAPATDSHGDGTNYGGCFKVYASDLEGCADVVRWFARRPAVLDAADTGNGGFFSTAMRAEKYYEGFGPDIRARIEHHDEAVVRNATAIAAALDEPLMLSLHAPAWTPPNLPDLAS